MTVVFVPERKHNCQPGWSWDSPGTVVECDKCNNTWVAYKLPPNHGVLVTYWRREGLLERWRRERRTKKESS